jgi:hypothetical protein
LRELERVPNHFHFRWRHIFLYDTEQVAHWVVREFLCSRLVPYGRIYHKHFQCMYT